MKNILLFILLILNLNLYAFDHTYKTWDKILKKYVIKNKNQSYVNYKNLKKNDESFKQFVNSIGEVEKEEFEKFSNNQKVAFLINSYNALTIKLIIDNYPVASIKDLGSFWSTPWKKKIFNLFGKKRHLDYIEHGILRKIFKDPRLHFAVNCASLGCPSLLGYSINEQNLEKYLSVAEKNFLENREKNFYSHQEKTIYLSPIMKWYRSDFEEKFGSLKNYIKNKRRLLDLKDVENVEISFSNYSWKLNDFKE